MVVTETEEAEVIEVVAEAETVNLSQSHVLIVVRKILFHSSQAAIVQFFAGIVSRLSDKDNQINKKVSGVSVVLLLPLK